MPGHRGLVVAACIVVSIASLMSWDAFRRSDRSDRRMQSKSASEGARRMPRSTEPAPSETAEAPPSVHPGRRIAFFRAPARKGTPAEIARALLDENRSALGLDLMPGTLELTREFESLGGWHLRYRQVVDGAPVFGSEVSAHVTRDGRPLLVQANVWPVAGVADAPRVGSAAAQQAAREFATDEEDREEVATKPAELVVLPVGRAGVLAWRVDLRTDAASLRTFVDATSGEVVRCDPLRAADVGVGAIFDPNPVYTLRDGSLTDGSDRDSARLTHLRRIVTLPHLDGSGWLRGTWADLSRTSSPSYSAALDWSGVTRSDNAFEQVMAYWHVDAAQQRLRDLGITNANSSPQRIDAHALSGDQSYFDPYDDVLRFGDGGVDDAEDADIIRHEYAHAIQFDQVSDWGLEDEGAAMGEGFGDFHAASFHAGDPAFDPLVGSWDATSYSHQDPPFLRRVDLAKRYPTSLVSEPHADGEIWSRFLWDLRALVGNDDALRVVLESHFLLTATSRFADGANAVLLANDSLRDGADDIAIRHLLDDRGLPYSAPLAHPPEDDPFEDNDDVEHATPIASGTASSLVCADDDWYVIEVPAFRRLHVTATSDPSAIDLGVELHALTGSGSSTTELVATAEGISGQASVDASAGAGGARYAVRIHDLRPGTHIGGYEFAVTGADLLPLVPGRAALVHAPNAATTVLRIDVPAAKLGGRLRLTSLRRRAAGPVADLRVIAPSGAVLLEFGGERRPGGVRAAFDLDQSGAYFVEVRSRDARTGDIRLRADFR